MKEIGYEKVFRDELGNVVGMLLGRRSEPTLLLNCHMDTVGVGQRKEWKEDPFGGVIKDGRLYGRGASDCKGGLAAHVFVGDLLKRSLLPLNGNLVVAATVAEENGCGIGVRELLEKTLPELGLEPTYAILGEPTGLGLYYGHDGWIEVDIRVEGANPFQVDDAANAIFDDISAHHASGSATDLSLGGPRFETCTGLRKATITVDRRLGASENAGQLLGQIRHEAELAARGAGTVAVDVAVRQEAQTLYTGHAKVVRRVTSAWSTDPFHPLMERSRQALAAAGCEVRPGRWELGRLGMGTAGGMLTKGFKVPTIGYGPGEEDMAHAADESVDTEKIVEAVYGTAAIVHSLIGIPVFGWTADEI